MRILLVAHVAPPSPMSAARRTAGLARHWGLQGHEVTVITSLLNGRGPVEGARRTIRTRDLMAGRLNWRAENFAALSGSSDAVYAAEPSPLAAYPVPDLQTISWAPFALAHVLQLVRRRAVDVVVTSSPPASVHLVGLAASRLGLPWVADFRDGWRFERTGGDFEHAAQRKLDDRLERAVARRADLVVGVTPPITEDLVRRHGVRGLTITNGNDAEGAPAPEASWKPPLDRDRHSLVYTGTLAFGGHRMEPVWAAVALLRKRDPELAQRLQMVFAGPLSVQDRATLEDPRIQGVARSVGSLPLGESLALQRSADSLLLLAGEWRTSTATGKLYEYLAARRPILVLGERTAAARIVRDSDAGLVANAEDPEQIAAALRRLVAGEGPVGATAETAARYGYAEIAGRYASALAELRAAPTLP